ncbi:type II toxin-antitoxin system RelE/ParE family toxin [Sphingobacterium sp. MYb382]|uniref:type II toxin-antitoxin system RelE/ParE family toxin n=1 Tax=Sphingobacterium sp. MYb382 TaxID=2745278 RepID=UPI0030A781A7
MGKYDLEVTNEVLVFIRGFDEITQDKILKTFDKIVLGYFGNHYSKMPGTDLYECRVGTRDFWLRFLTRHEKRHDGTIVIVLHGFKKKTNKIPQKEIDKANNIYNRR